MLHDMSKLEEIQDAYVAAYNDYVAAYVAAYIAELNKTKETTND